MSSSALESLPSALSAYREFAASEDSALRDRLASRISDSCLIDLIAGEISHPGKHLRPALTLASFLVFSGGKAPSRECLAAAHALEIFHTFVLIHDDVIDGSEQRRNRPTLQKRIEAVLGMNEKAAGHLAIVLGDILFGYAIDLLSAPEMNREWVAPLQQYLATVTEDTGLGEAQELTFLDRPLAEVTLQQIEEVYYLKTTRYTIEAPLWLGARAAGMQAPELEALSDFARPIGLGFQMENDLHEASLPLEEFKRLAYDFQTGVKTYFLRRFYEDLGKDSRQKLTALLSRCREETSAMNDLHEMIQSTETLGDLKKEVEKCFSHARDWVPQAPYSEEHRVGLEQIAQFISTQRKHSEARN